MDQRRHRRFLLPPSPSDGSLEGTERLASDLGFGNSFGRSLIDVGSNPFGIDQTQTSPIRNKASKHLTRIVSQTVNRESQALQGGKTTTQKMQRLLPRKTFGYLTTEDIWMFFHEAATGEKLLP